MNDTAIKEVYEEYCFGKWCLKYQAAGKPLIMVTDEDKSVAYEKLKQEINSQNKD